MHTQQHVYIHNSNTRCCNVIKLILCYLTASLDYTYARFPTSTTDQRFAYNIHFKLRKSILVTAVRQGSSLANSAMLVPPNVRVTVLNRGKGYRRDCYGGDGYWWNRYVSYSSSCADQPGKPHCEVNNDHCNTSQYQQEVVDKYTTVAP